MEESILIDSIDDGHDYKFQNEDDILNILQKKDQITIDQCKKEHIYLLHKLFQVLTSIDKLKSMKIDWKKYKKYYLYDSNGKTWLHYALENENINDISIINFLINDLQLRVNEKDNYGFTALHIAFRKDKLIDGEIEFLLETGGDLLSKSCNDKTPLEFACFNKKKLEIIDKNLLKSLIKKVENICDSVPIPFKKYYYIKNLKTNKMWLNILKYDDKYRLQYIMKDLPNFSESFYLKPEDFFDVLGNCNENGKGLLEYIKKLISVETNKDCAILFQKLSGLEIYKIQKNKVFYKSAIFLALITGRFKLVPSLLMYSRRKLILYGLLTCLICGRLSKIKQFPDQVIEEILKVKQFCEDYSIAILNKTEVRDLTNDKRVVFEYLNQSEKLMKQTILEIAFLSKSSKFLGLPSCQKSLANLWNQKTYERPSVKFYVHAVFHILFLGLFSYILLWNFYFNVSIEETFCYIYGIGYLVEEIFHTRKLKQLNLISLHKNDATIYVDYIGIILMGLGFIVRMTISKKNFLSNQLNRQYNESVNQLLNISRLILCASLIFFYIRVIYFGFIFKILGPKLKMIGKMIVKDLLPLSFIFLIFIISFGVTFQSLLFPNNLYILLVNHTFDQKSTVFIIQEIFRRAAFTIFDSRYIIEEIEDRDNVYLIDDIGKKSIYFITILYVILANVMLMNLLIALFSETVTDIIEQSKESWKANRYGYTFKYYYCSILPPPLNLIEIFLKKILIPRCRKRKFSKDFRQKYQSLNERSFRILQIFALQNCRFKLIETDEDKNYEKEMELESLQKSIASLNQTVLNLEREFKKID